MTNKTIPYRHPDFLSVVHEGPDLTGGERFFHADLAMRDLDDLKDERQRIRLRLLLTDRRERGRWPATWLQTRLERLEAELGAARR